MLEKKKDRRIRFKKAEGCGIKRIEGGILRRLQDLDRKDRRGSFKEVCE